MHLLKLMLKANGRRGVPQGGVLSPTLSNVCLSEVDRMLERAPSRAACEARALTHHLWENGKSQFVTGPFSLA